MEEAEALALADRICEFLVSCGGNYGHVSNEMQWNVIHALASDQFSMKEVAGEIVYFVSFWKIQPEDVEKIQHRIKPSDIIRGSVVYVSEAGNKGTRKDLAEMITGIRLKTSNCTGVIWHRPVKQDKVYYFARQKGKEV